jgi:hypothetical protein
VNLYKGSSFFAFLLVNLKMLRENKTFSILIRLEQRYDEDKKSPKGEET